MHGTFALFAVGKNAAVASLSRSTSLKMSEGSSGLGNLKCDNLVKVGAFYVLIDSDKIPSQKAAKLSFQPIACEFSQDLSKTWYYILFVF